MQLWQYCLLVTARSLCPSSGILKTVVAATGACHGSGWYISSRKLHSTQYTHHSLKYLLPQHRKSYNNVFLLINSTLL